MNITIDSGNSSTKVGFFENDSLVKIVVLENINQLDGLLREYKNASVIISSVNLAYGTIKEKLKDFKRILSLDQFTKIPLGNKYQSPETLGMDRLAASVGARHFCKTGNCLIIDAGSCITYDLVDVENNYQGGSISPGIQIRFKSLHAFTSKLPLMHVHDYANQLKLPLTGKNTRESILSGVINGMVAEVNGIIQEYHNLYPDLRILICGGDANYFESKIKQSIFAIPELVHWGLNRILAHNESEF